MILWSLELIFPVVLFNGFSCLEEFLGNYSYQSLELSSMVGEYSKILHNNCIKLEKRWLIMSFILYSFRFLCWLSALTVWSIKVISFCILGGHNQIIVLYWSCIELWCIYDHEIFPNFQNIVPNTMEISHQEVDPEVCSSLHIKLFGSNRGRNHRDLAVLKCNLLSNHITCHKMGLTLQQNS